MRRCLCLFLLLLGIFFAGCDTDNPRASFKTVEYSDYRQIPGVTSDEIDAIERLRANNASFVFGMPEGVSCFRRENGSLDGYSVLFCNWLSDLFGIPFNPVIYEWNELINGIFDLSIPFTGALHSSTTGPDDVVVGGRLIKTDPIKEQTVIAVTRKEDLSLSALMLVPGSIRISLATLFPRAAHSRIDLPLIHAERNAAQKASPAPTVFRGIIVNVSSR